MAHTPMLDKQLALQAEAERIVTSMRKDRRLTLNVILRVPLPSLPGLTREGIRAGLSDELNSTDELGNHRYRENGTEFIVFDEHHVINRDKSRIPGFLVVAVVIPAP